ncbi:maleylpyruvate isomerase family mycothiol-dependent enzyme [Pseudonocardia xinjiangensis]|uniref:maleylpyruvate isomerase family mycothiol-dependent enzyme n=1 Tax=Pseudonocardia xinjiangensis TaxID=75289 RepID=UPI003D91AB0D
MTQELDLAIGTGFDAAEYLEVLHTEGRLILKIAREHGLAAEIASCPGWTMRDLIAHLGFAYRWARTIVTEERSVAPRPSELSALEDPDPSDDVGVIDRMEQAHSALVAALRETPATLDCWTIWPSSVPSRDFWIRRQVHETLVHRVDAQTADYPAARGGESLVSALAADGVDELVCGFADRYRQHLRIETPRTLALRATDTSHRWWIALGPDEPAFGRGPAPGVADAEVHALSGELLMLLWNRRTSKGLDVRGDRSVLETWRRHAHL